MRWVLQYHLTLILDALGMRLQESCRWHIIPQPCSAHLKWDVSFPDFMYLIFSPHASHGGPLADTHGGPGFVSIPALIRRSRREWAGFVPPICQKTTFVVGGGDVVDLDANVDRLAQRLQTVIVEPGDVVQVAESTA